MNLLYQRTETDDKVVIIFKPYSMYLLLAVLIALMAVTFVPILAQYEPSTNFLMPVAVVVVIARIILMHKVNREVQQGIRDGSVNVTGSKLSANNPLTFVITKKVQ